MSLRDKARERPEYQAALREQSEVPAQRPQTATVGGALAPVLNWEKSDVLFWTEVLQLVLLLLILRELRSGGVP